LLGKLLPILQSKSKEGGVEETGDEETGDEEAGGEDISER
jgi:hypothetical protein